LGWLKAARLALKEPSSEHSNLFVAGDGTQRLFHSRPFSWTDAGIHARGRTRILKRNYRNTEQILQTAYPFAAVSQSGIEGGPRDRTPTPDCFRQGPRPSCVELASRNAECNKAVDLVHSWLKDGVEIRGQHVRLQPNEIAILYPRLPSDASSLLQGLQKALSEFTSSCRLDEQEATLDDDGVRIVSIRKATGLQFRAVILLWADLLPSYRPESDERTLFYLAMTRAEDVLAILHSGRSEYVDEIRARIKQAS
jgi:superfamily I DNA/RNA helicase